MNDNIMLIIIRYEQNLRDFKHGGIADWAGYSPTVGSRLADEWWQSETLTK